MKEVKAFRHKLCKSFQYLDGSKILKHMIPEKRNGFQLSQSIFIIKSHNHFTKLPLNGMNH